VQLNAADLRIPIKGDRGSPFQIGGVRGSRIYKENHKKKKTTDGNNRSTKQTNTNKQTNNELIAQTILRVVI
jgi:hypothetical protein